MPTSFKKDVTLPDKPAQKPKQPSSFRTEMLTPSEIEALRADKRETSDLAGKAFQHLRPKAGK
jgi:hypothetical protein